MTRLFNLMLVSCIAALFAFGSSAASATTRFVSPTGSASDLTCDAAHPCEIHHAIEIVAQGGDDVIVAPGDYALVTYIFVGQSLNIRGQDGQPRPRLAGSPVTASILIQGTGSVSLRHLDVRNDRNGTAAIRADAAATLADLIVTATGTGSTGVLFGAGGNVLRDSFVWTTGPGATSVSIFRSPAVEYPTADLRNVTAIATGATSNGVEVTSGCPFCSGSNVTTAKNTIARGTQYDFSILASDSVVKLVPSYSNFRPTMTNEFNAGDFEDGGNNQSAEPLFANAAAGDFHELAGSPTIDAGVVDSLTGTTDIDGGARLVGAAPDIGADEFVPTAQATDTVAPNGTALKLSPSSFVPDTNAPSVSRKKKKHAGSTITYTMSEAATVAFTVQRKAKGRKKGKKCSTTRKKGKRCTAYKTLKGTFSRASSAGANSFRFTGNVNGKPLKRGSYRLLGTPTDAAGNHGAAFRGSFKILRR